VPKSPIQKRIKGRESRAILPEIKCHRSQKEARGEKWLIKRTAVVQGRRRDHALAHAAEDTNTKENAVTDPTTNRATGRGAIGLAIAQEIALVIAHVIVTAIVKESRNGSAPERVLARAAGPTDPDLDRACVPDPTRR